MQRIVYFDNCATTRVSEKAAQTALRSMRDEFYNPSATYSKGIEAMDAREDARRRILAAARFPGTLVFTSGGTEADNLAMSYAHSSGKRIIISTVEHAAIAKKAAAFKQSGGDLVVLKVDRCGRISIPELREALMVPTALVSIMEVNNETGALQDIGEISRCIRAASADTLFHTDAVQGFLRTDTDYSLCDMVSVSGHKLHAPKGIGALLIKDTAKVRPVIYGGGQESDLRSGTENMPGILAFAEAIDEYSASSDENISRLRAMKLRLWEGLCDMPKVRVNGPVPEEGAPHILSLGVSGVRAATLQQALDTRGILVGTGSACKSHGARVSAVILEHGVERSFAEGTVRISLSPLNTMEEVEYAIPIVREIITSLSRFVRR